MPTVARSVSTRAPLDRVWPFLADFTTVTRWDPHTPSCRRVSGDGGVGTVYAVTSVFRGRETHLRYTVATLEPRERLVLHGANATVTVVEDLRFAEHTDGAVDVDHDARFTFRGAARLAAPFLRGALRDLADDAARGMTDALAALVAPADSVASRNGAPLFEVRSEWKETVHYVEGDRRMTFDAGWGVSPPVLYVPDPSIWDQVVPDWLVGRQTEVTARLRAHSGHVVEFTTSGYGPSPT